MTFTPGVIVGGMVSHACPVARGVGYFLEPAVALAPFGKKPTRLTLTGVTNNGTDPSVDTLRTVTLPLLKRFGVEQDIELKINRRGVRRGRPVPPARTAPDAAAPRPSPRAVARCTSAVRWSGR